MKEWLIKFISGVAQHYGFPHRGLKYFISFLKAVGLYNNSFIGRTRFGCRFYCNLNDHIERYIFWYGWYEKTESRFLLSKLFDGLVMIDVGANIGYYSLLVAMNASHSQVYAFEPSTNNANKLKHNIRLNGVQNIEVIQMAAGNENRELILYHSANDNSGMTALSIPENPAGTSEKVNSIKIDDWFQELGLAEIHLVKIDVEGFEFAVLEGMKITIETYYPLVLVEIKGENAKRFNYHSPGVHFFFRQMGYQGFEIKPGNKLVEIIDLEKDIDLAVFIHPKRKF